MAITELKKQVNYLKEIGEINTQDDLVEIFGIKKSTISTYLNGKPGKEFLAAFNKRFELRLLEFKQVRNKDSQEDSEQSLTEEETEVVDYRKEYEKLLKDTNLEKSQIIKTFSDKIEKLESSLNMILKNHRSIAAVQNGALRTILENLVEGKDLNPSARKRGAAQLKILQEADSYDVEYIYRKANSL